MSIAANADASLTTPCDSWEDFCNAVRLKDGSPLDPIYRGHGEYTWPLVAPSARGHYEQVRQLQSAGQDVRSGGPASRGQLKYFKHLATGLPGVDVSALEKEIDVEALARHHGLCSNLLDWTRSPYVAAFFAFTSALDRANDGRLLAGTLAYHAVFMPTRPVCIWRLGAGEDLWVPGEFELLASLALINYWQKAQSGVFIRLAHKEHLDVVSYLAGRGLLSRLHQFVIPGSETGKALSDLESMNITYATLFPNLRGAAMQANVGDTWRFIGANI
jgi:hypothetical protein